MSSSFGTSPLAASLANASESAQLEVSGSKRATALLSVSSSGTATFTAQYSKNGGLSWLPAPYATKISDTGANPACQPLSASALTNGDVWEIPLPGNCTHLRLLCDGSGTPVSFTLAEGLPYVPGCAVATLFDVTPAVGAAVDTGPMDLSGWSSLSSYARYDGATSGAFNPVEVDDAGVNISGIGYTSIGVTTTPLIANWGANVFAPTAMGGGNYVGLGTHAKRMRFSLAAVAAQTGRIRIQARR